MRNDPPIRIGGLQSKALYQFTMQEPEHQGALRFRAGFHGEDARAARACTDVSSDLQIRNPQINVDIDRDERLVAMASP